MNKEKEKVTDDVSNQKQVVWYESLVNAYINVGVWQDKYLLSMSALSIVVLICMGGGMVDVVNITLRKTSMIAFFLVIVVEFVIMKLNKLYLTKLINNEDCSTANKLLQVCDIIAITLFILSSCMLIAIGIRS